MEQISDHEILRLFNKEATRSKAFALLMDKYQQKMYWLIRRMVFDHTDTDDILQETFIKVWENLHTFRGESRLFSWLYRVTFNEAISFLKKKRKDLGLENQGFSDHMENILDDNYRMDCSEIEKRLQKAILQLPEMQRTVFQMRYFDMMDYEEISEVVGSSTNSVKTSYHFATKKIEKFLKED